MSLNLDSLKNLSGTSIDTSGTGNTSTSSAQHSPVTPDTTASAPEIHEKKQTPITGQKISLMKLKKASGMDMQITRTEVCFGMGTEKQEPETLPSAPDTTIWEKIDTSEIVSEEKPTTPLTSKEIGTREPVTPDSEISHSILSEEKESSLESGKQTRIETIETKELFPNFRISENLSLDQDLLELPDVPIIPEQKETVIAVNDVDTISKKAKNHGPATPEYIAEVKTELSEGRKAGFRFFTQRKNRIIAGLGLVALSISVVTLFSGSFLSHELQKSWKGNVQEVVSTESQTPRESAARSTIVPLNTATGTNSGTQISPDAPSPEKNNDYEIGVDYSVTKNTKKNIRHETSSGAKVTTPQKDLIK